MSDPGVVEDDLLDAALPFPPSCTERRSFDHSDPHEDHLFAEPDRLWIPGLGGPGESVRLTGAAPVMPPVWTVGRGIECVLTDGTRTYVESQFVAHARECSSDLCILVWRRAQLLQDHYPDGDCFRLFAAGSTHQREPVLVDRDTYTWYLSCEGDEWSDNFGVRPEIADGIRAWSGHTQFRCALCPPSGVVSEHYHG